MGVYPFAVCTTKTILFMVHGRLSSTYARNPRPVPLLQRTPLCKWRPVTPAHLIRGRDDRLHPVELGLRQMALDGMPGPHFPVRRQFAFAAAARHPMLPPAARMEWAARRWRDGRRDLTLQHDALLGDRRIGDGHSGEQRLRIGMIGRLENILGGAL